jgi:hypothetical protein
VGKVGRDLQGFGTKDLLPSVGAGLRFLTSEKERVNTSVDYARGREGDAIYFYIGETFYGIERRTDRFHLTTESGRKLKR